MPEFLAGRDLSQKIREIVSGNDVKCAVAYWGKHNFPPPHTHWKIVCDIVGGSTSPAVLKALGAPTNRNLRHYVHLHAKVYLSDKGVVIGSANASAGGLHSDSAPARLLEAGVWHAPSDAIWAEANQWFDEIFTESDPVNEKALELAEINYAPPTIEIRENPKGKSPLRQIAFNHEFFNKQRICFILCNIDTTKKTREEAAKEICAEDPSLSEDVKEIIKKSDSSHTFLHWDEKDIENLNKNIILFFMDPRGRNSISTHTLLTTCRTHNKEWHFYTDDLGIKEIKMPDGKNFKKTSNEWEIIEAIINKEGSSRIYRPREFSELLREFYE